MVSQNSKMMDSDISTESQSAYENVFCNPVFEPDEENEENKGNFKIDIYLEPTKKPAADHSVVNDCLMTLREQLGGHGTIMVSTGVLLITAILCIILLVLNRQANFKTSVN